MDPMEHFPRGMFRSRPDVLHGLADPDLHALEAVGRRADWRALWRAPGRLLHSALGVYAELAVSAGALLPRRRGRRPRAGRVADRNGRA